MWLMGCIAIVYHTPTVVFDILSRFGGKIGRIVGGCVLKREEMEPRLCPQRPLNIRKILASFPQSPDKFSKSTLEVR